MSVEAMKLLYQVYSIPALTCFLIFGKGLLSLAIYLTEAYLFLKFPKSMQIKLLTSACRNPVLLPEVEVLMDRGNLHGIPLQDLAPRKIQGVLDQSQGPDLNPGPDPEEVLEGIIQGHDLDPAPIDDPGAGLTAEIIEDGTATAILPCLLEGVMLGTGQILTPTVVLEYLD